MEQINANMEIAFLLLKGKSHIREIARKLNISHTMARHKLDALLKENVVDFATEGKNKAYFLKNTAEARAYAIMAEKYALVKALHRYPELRGFTDKVMADDRIKLAIIFGSYAKGIAKKDSDIDLYIETEDIKLKKEIQLSDSKLSVKIGKYNKESLLIKEIEKNHIILKGAELYYEKSRFFG